MDQIIIWDDNAKRIQEMEKNLKIAMNKLGLHALVQINCEPPLLSRFNLIGQTPKIEVQGDMWTYKIGQIVSSEQFETLLRMTLVPKL